MVIFLSNIMRLLKTKIEILLILRIADRTHSHLIYSHHCPFSPDPSTNHPFFSQSTHKNPQIIYRSKRLLNPNSIIKHLFATLFPIRGSS